jgi:hypothetical protein
MQTVYISITDGKRNDQLIIDGHLYLLMDLFKVLLVANLQNDIGESVRIKGGKNVENKID